jgi:hypothetical protein
MIIRLLVLAVALCMLLPSLGYGDAASDKVYEKIRDGLIQEQIDAERRKDFATAKSIESTIEKLAESHENNVPLIVAKDDEDGKTEAAPSGKKNVFTDLTGLGFSLKRAEAGEGDASQQASFAYLEDFHNAQKTAFSSDFYLSWQPQAKEEDFREITDYFWTPKLSAAGSFNSAQKASANSWTYKASAVLYNGESAIFDASETDFSLKDESDGDYNLNRLSFEALWTPTISAAGIGQGILWDEREPDTNGNVELDTEGHLPRKSIPLRFSWRPWFGVDAGGNISNEGGDHNENVQLTQRTTVSLEFLQLANALDMDDFSLFADNHYVFLATDDRGYDYLQTGLSLKFTPNIGLNLTYTLGANAPKFTYADSLQIALGLGF